MKIDIALVYLLAFLACTLFQNFFTTVHYIYDVAYYRGEELNQSSFTSRGVKSHPEAIRGFLLKESAGDDVVVVNMQLRETIRYFKPIWKAEASDQ